MTDNSGSLVWRPKYRTCVGKKENNLLSYVQKDQDSTAPLNSLFMYCTACFSWLKVRPVLEKKRRLKSALKVINLQKKNKDCSIISSQTIELTSIRFWFIYSPFNFGRMYLVLADSEGTVMINVSSGSRHSSGVSGSLADLEFGAYLSRQKKLD